METLELIAFVVGGVVGTFLIVCGPDMLHDWLHFRYQKRLSKEQEHFNVAVDKEIRAWERLLRDKATML